MNNTVTRVWDDVALQYHKLVGNNGDIYHKTYLNPVILKLIQPIKNTKILDLACGQGYFSRILAKKGASVIAIDISPKLIKIASDFEKNDPLGIQYAILDTTHLKNIKDKSIETIVCNMALHDIKNVKQTIRECSRVLRSNGIIVFSIIHPLYDVSIMKKDAEGYYKIMRHYMSKLILPNLLFGSSGITSYHRPIGYYTEILRSYNFDIQEIKEICTGHQGGNIITNKTILAHEQEFPSFLIIKSKKAN